MFELTKEDLTEQKIMHWVDNSVLDEIEVVQAGKFGPLCSVLTEELCSLVLR
jgi:hypothetical protein